MMINRTDRFFETDLLLDEDWDQLAADGLIVDVDALIADLKKSAVEEFPISLNFGG